VGEVFTLPHIVRLDSTGLQVIFQSPPRVQVLFFLVGAQPNYGTNFTWSPPELQMGVQVNQPESVDSRCQQQVYFLYLIHLDYNRHIYFDCIILYLIISNNNEMKKKMHYWGIEHQSTEMNDAMPTAPQQQFLGSDTKV